MAQQHTPDSIIIDVTLTDGTKSGFSFAEYLLWAYHQGPTIEEADYARYVSWLRADNNEPGRLNAWSNVTPIRKLYPRDPTVTKFRQYAKKNHIPI